MFDSGPLEASVLAYDTKFHDRISRITCSQPSALCIVPIR